MRQQFRRLSDEQSVSDESLSCEVFRTGEDDGEGQRLLVRGTRPSTRR